MRNILCALVLAAFAPPTAQADAAGGWFKLQTHDRADAGGCLEGNDAARGTVLGGAAFLDSCRDVSGQLWNAIPVAAARFRLQTAFLGAGACLGVSRGVDADGFAAGTAIMRDCAAAGEAVFTAEPAAGGAVRLVLGADAGCLAGRPAGAVPGAVVAAAVEACSEAGTQRWALLGGHLVDRIPRPERGAAITAPAAAELTGHCLWDDGAGDNPEQFACRLERLDRRGSVRATGEDYSYELVVGENGAGVARATLSRRSDTVDLGRFVRERSDRSCWSNDLSGMRFCAR